MIARPRISRNEWKMTEIGAFQVGNFALFSCPGAYHESEEWRYGRKVLSALDSFAVPRETPDELRHDLDLLHKLEATLDDRGGAQSTPLLKDPDVPDDDLPELAICLREEIENLRGSVDDARRSIASLEARAHDQGLPPPPSSARRDMPPSPP